MRRVTWLVLFSLAASCCLAQHGDTDVVTVERPPSIAAIQEKRDALGEAQEAARDLYDEAIARLERAAVSVENAVRFRAETAAAPATLLSIREELGGSARTPDLSGARGATVETLERLEAEAVAALSAARQTETQLQVENDRRQERRVAIQSVLPELRSQLAGVDEALRSAPAESQDAQLADARRAALEAQRYELASRIDELEAERASYDARRDLLPARRDLAARRVAELETGVSAWTELVAQARREAATSRADAVAEQAGAEGLPPAFRAYATETRRLAEQRTSEDGYPQRINGATLSLAELRATFAALQQRYVSVQQRIAVSGLDRATGVLLRREFVSLPSVTELGRQAEEIDRELEDVAYELFARRDGRTGSDDISLVSARLIETAMTEASTPDTPVADRAVLEPLAVELATARRDVLADLEGDADRYQDLLVELERESDRLIEATVSYGSFIRERILWVRSVQNDDLASSLHPRVMLGWLVEDGAWPDAFGRVRADIGARFPVTLIGIAAVLISFAAGLWSVRRLDRISDRVRSYRTDAFAHTVNALALTLLGSLPGALLLWTIGTLLARPVDQNALATGIGEGLVSAAPVLWALGFARLALRPGGLSDAHFRWAAGASRLARRLLLWFTPLACAAIVLIAGAQAAGGEGAVSSLGRIAFTASMLGASYVILRLLRPGGEIARDLAKGRAGGWLARAALLLPVCLVAVPGALIALAWMGYFYTALALGSQLSDSVLLIGVLALVNALLMRWLFLARRRVAVEDAKRRREQAAAAEAGDLEPAEAVRSESGPSPIDEDKLDLPAISLQTRQLFRTSIWVSALIGLYLIWADVLPALRMLDRVEVYPTPRIVESAQDDTIPVLETLATVRAGAPAVPAPADAGADPGSGVLGVPGLVPGAEPSSPAPDASGAREPVTVSDLGLTIIILIATLVAFRNLPGLIEIVVLQRLPLDAGSRYALSTVLKYIIAIFGIAAAFSAVNLAWSNIQWLAAALTFGLAFGLQEIFANFISGLIILAERPIRIGDTVTVGGVSGTVSRIRMRATTITDWDRKELVIPNKTFITGDVINWTLSNPMLRVIVPVGVAYGSDVRRVESILLEVAARSSLVLDDPKAYVVFSRFGESTLDFELRVFIPHVDQVLAVRHEMNMGIDDAFREAGIEIAFPQRDLHVRSIGDLRELIAPPGETGRGALTPDSE